MAMKSFLRAPSSPEEHFIKVSGSKMKARKFHSATENLELFQAIQSISKTHVVDSGFSKQAT